LDEPAADPCGPQALANLTLSDRAHTKCWIGAKPPRDCPKGLILGLSPITLVRDVHVNLDFRVPSQQWRVSMRSEAS
jgi:hypothetical protein